LTVSHPWSTATPLRSKVVASALHGIDAQESGQTCTRNRRRYRCGQEAAFALDDKIGSQVVTCASRH
jgi:endonuclease YncB( thermonuclease family)